MIPFSTNVVGVGVIFGTFLIFSLVFCILWAFSIKKVIPLVLVRYEMITANSLADCYK